MEQFVLELAPAPAPTFGNFVVGPNAAVIAALQALVAGTLPHTVMFLWGTTGAGRTHLLRASIAAADMHPNAAFYADAAGSEEAFAAQSLADERLRLIALDDVHRLPPATAQSWFERFNALRAAGVRMLFAADRPPSALAMRDDLRTRLASGVVLEVVSLSEPETLAAMRAHANARKMPLPEGLLAYLLGRAPRDLGSQIALLDALDRYALATKRPLTLPLARTVLQQLDRGQDAVNPTKE